MLANHVAGCARTLRVDLFIPVVGFRRPPRANAPNNMAVVM
jgi:hypothetical protein